MKTDFIFTTEAIVPTEEEIVTQREKNPIKLSFHDISYEIEINSFSSDSQNLLIKETHAVQILKNATGYGLPGETLYIMGSSGAGKTSLLNILSDRICRKKRGCTVNGQVLINDSMELTQDFFGSIAGYAMQDDILYMYFTPREALMFAAEMKLTMTRKQKERKVEEILQELGLLSCANTLIGSNQRKTLSGGERKRTAIGVELITDPQLLLLDEPTAGLDTMMALSLVKLLQTQARKGKTIISTIHQPSSDAFQLFDRLILMTDGNIIFQGYANQSAKYFGSLGFECPIRSNPTDYYMKIFTVSYPKKESDTEKVNYLVTEYNKQIQEKIIVENSKHQLLSPDFHAFSSQSQWQQFKILLWRNKQGIKRDPKQIVGRITQNIIIGLLVLSVFHDLDGESFGEKMGLSGCLFFMVTNQSMMALMTTLLIFEEERPIFLREYANKMYSISSYYFAKILLDTPVLSISPIIFTLMTYFKVGLVISAAQYFIFCLIIILVIWAFSGFGYLLSCIFPQGNYASDLAPAIMLPMMTFAGFYANSASFPVWIKWMQWLSPQRYAFEALVTNQFDPDNTGADEFVQLLGFDLGLWRCILILIAFTIVFRFIALVFLKLLIQKVQ